MVGLILGLICICYPVPVQAFDYKIEDDVILKADRVENLEKDISYIRPIWLKEFEKDYSLIIVDSIDNTKKGDDIFIKGLHSYSNKIILLQKDLYNGVFFHEFGHFIQKRMSDFENIDFVAFDTLLIDIYKEEQDGLSKIMGNYCKTNYKEFFAESYEYGMNLVKLRELDEDFFYIELNRWGINCPRMKTLIWDGIINNSDILYNLDVINGLINDVKVKYPNYQSDYSYFRILLSGLF